MDKKFMIRALQLAKKGVGRVDPNPLVGAVIVRDGRIIGEGYHQLFGKEHAEVNAFKNATEPVDGATMYVTLEPCSHYGKTPPCASLIVEKNIARVVIASIDPNVLVAGRGVRLLTDAGIKVDIGLMDKENKELNKVFFKFIQTKIPYVVLKTAMTLDGKIATYTYQSKWITNDISRKIVHQMRNQFMSIMVGVRTVIHDNPSLTCRLKNKNVRQPIRIIIDTYLDIPMDTNVVLTAHQIPTIVFTAKNVNQEKKNDLKKMNVHVEEVSLKNGKLDLYEITTIIGRKGINSILLEGGGTLNFGALEAKIVDEIQAFIAPKIIGGKLAVTSVGGQGYENLDEAIILDLQKVEKHQGDLRVIYKIRKEV